MHRYSAYGLAGLLVAAMAIAAAQRPAAAQQPSDAPEPARALQADTVLQPNDTLPEGQAMVVQLGDASVIIYWQGEPDGWHVVITVDTAPGEEGAARQHAIVRFASVLLPGQSQLISVPVVLGERQPVLRIRRLLPDRIRVERVFGPSA
jgi:hypothetical protein